MSDKLVNSIAGRLSLRRPLAESLGILSGITGLDFETIKSLLNE
jgi:hypothetical protein